MQAVYNKDMKCKLSQREILEAILREKGKVFFVGGCVRDHLLRRESYDVDVEVYGLSATRLEAILSAWKELDFTGKAYGIYRAEELDIALPRKEIKIGEGHQDFQVVVDEHLSLKEAARRRDFTMNAIFEEYPSGKWIDVYQGKRDIIQKKIRHIDAEKFVEDPLRVYRAARFAAQLAFCIADETLTLAKKMKTSSLSQERKREELVKALQSRHPSLFFLSLAKMEKLPPYLLNIPWENMDFFQGSAKEKTYLVLLSWLLQQVNEAEKEQFYQEFLFTKKEKKAIDLLVNYHRQASLQKADTYFLYRDLGEIVDCEEYLQRRKTCFMSKEEFHRQKLQVNASYLLQKGFCAKEGFSQHLRYWQQKEINQGFQAVEKEMEKKNGSF